MELRRLRCFVIFDLLYLLSVSPPDFHSTLVHVAFTSLHSFSPPPSFKLHNLIFHHGRFNLRFRAHCCCSRATGQCSSTTVGSKSPFLSCHEGPQGEYYERILQIFYDPRNRKLGWWSVLSTCSTSTFIFQSFWTLAHDFEGGIDVMYRSSGRDKLQSAFIFE